MYAVRRWSVRHSAFMERFYEGFARLFLGLGPLWRLIGHRRLEAPLAAVERRAKGFFFDCRMCGQCVLSSTGMACPMNCPKALRNGPCGGVAPDGGCEIDPTMRCVWVEAWEGSRAMRRGDAITALGATPLDNRLEGTSSWLREVRQAQSPPEDDPGTPG
ncbi:MAG: methylenetetrahydrofolate reductase C-terminal domain-containing protein [Rhodospirillales bacterium]|nr:methylenetetrahydrofolate reductase C-terminal domain-containing protein [Rhodospirillales bacterium]